MAINPANFVEGFNYRLQDLMDYCRNLEPVLNLYCSVIHAILKKCLS